MKLRAGPLPGGLPGLARMLAAELEAAGRLSSRAYVPVTDCYAREDSLLIKFAPTLGVTVAEVFDHGLVDGARSDEASRSTQPGDGSPKWPGDAATFFLGSEIAAALAEAHSGDDPIAHGSLDPVCVLIDSNGQPRIIGLGATRLLQGLPPGCVDLPPQAQGFAAPETLRGESATAASDVYSLATLLWSLLVGRRPDPWPARMKRISEHRKDVPRQLVAAIDTALDPLPRNRTIRCEDFAKMLGRLVESSGGGNSVQDELAEMVTAFRLGRKPNGAGPASENAPASSHADSAAITAKGDGARKGAAAGAAAPHMAPTIAPGGSSGASPAGHSAGANGESQPPVGERETLRPGRVSQPADGDTGLGGTLILPIPSAVPKPDGSSKLSDARSQRKTARGAGAAAPDRDIPAPRPVNALPPARALPPTPPSRQIQRAPSLAELVHQVAAVDTPRVPHRVDGANAAAPEDPLIDEVTRPLDIKTVVAGRAAVRRAMGLADSEKPADDGLHVDWRSPLPNTASSAQPVVYSSSGTGSWHAPPQEGEPAPASQAASSKYGSAYPPHAAGANPKSAYPTQGSAYPPPGSAYPPGEGGYPPASAFPPGSTYPRGDMPPSMYPHPGFAPMVPLGQNLGQGARTESANRMRSYIGFGIALVLGASLTANAFLIFGSASTKEEGPTTTTVVPAKSAPTTAPSASASAPTTVASTAPPPPPIVSASAAPAASSATAESPVPEKKDPKSVDPLMLPGSMGVILVQSSAPATVYIHGHDVGKTNERLTTECGHRYVRIGVPHVSGQTYWLAQGLSTFIPCRGEVRLQIEPVNPMP